MTYLIPCLSSFLLTAAVTPLIILLAKRCNCLDVPGERRLHKTSTPRWGGVAFFVGVLPFLLTQNRSGSLTAYITASLLLVAVGMIDDRLSIGWKIKFSVMAAATAIVIFGGGLAIHNIGTYGPLGSMDLGLLSIPFTFFCIIGITNAINLLDGLDGLAGGVSLLGFLFMGIAATLAGNIMVAVICFAFVGALGAFLLYNFPNAGIFMGDTGSLFIGFSLAITAVLLTQDRNSSVNSMFPVLVLLIPIFDTIRVLIVRLLKGKNPFKADNLHLHYLFVQKNIPPAYVTLLFWALTAIFGGIGLALISSTSVTYLGAVLLASSLLTVFSVSLTQSHQAREQSDTGASDTNNMAAERIGFSSADNPAPVLARRVDTSLLKWVVVVGTVFLAARVLANF